ncbi:MAG: glycosyltransferase family A protein [Thermodesulfobacteriota bacterium]
MSAIIPTRDRVTMVQRALASVVTQTQPVEEIIVVDDGSQDDTARLLARIFPEIHLLRLCGAGCGPARNTGAAAASGDILMFLDSDDFWLPHHVERLQRALDRGHALAYGTTLTFDLLAGGSFLVPDTGAGIEGDCAAALSSWCFLLPSAFAVRRELFAAAGGFSDLPLAEDWDLFCRLAHRNSFGFCGPEPITVRHLHAGSACGRVNRACIADAMQALADRQCHGKEGDRSSHFHRLAEWTAGCGREFSTVQQWYLTLRAEGML